MTDNYSNECYMQYLKMMFLVWCMISMLKQVLNRKCSTVLKYIK